MKKIFKISFVIFIILICFNFTLPSLYGMTSSYDETMQTAVSNANEHNLLEIVSSIILPVVYPLFSTLAWVMQKVIYLFSGSNEFPWADNILFNRIAFLDVNFINPEPGSIFLSKSGSYTAIGNAVRNVYFSVLSISAGFLGIAVAFNSIKMILATIPSAKARYKEMINATLITMVLIFGMHYLISFIFYINEQLVQTASTMSEKVLSKEDVYEANQNIDKAEDLKNEEIVTNFFNKCNVTSWWSPITWVKSAGKALVNWIASVGDALKNLWDSFWGEDNEDETLTFTAEEKRENGYYDGPDKVFPSKEDYIGYFHNPNMVGENGINIAAFLLKDYRYREAILSMVAGNDANKFSNSGFIGWGRSCLNTVAWASGVVDTGLMGLENLYNSVIFIVSADGLRSYADLSTAAACEKRIQDAINSSNNAPDENTALGYHMNSLYYQAYYRYVYVGDDKKEIDENTSPIRNLGEYFRRNVYYVDTEDGDWSSTSFDVINCLLYCIFVLQSCMFLFSYIKRLLYVVVLSLLGPATVVFDYMKKSY